MEQFCLAAELTKVIRHFFPDLIPMLKTVSDVRHQGYVVYKNHVLLMTRILSSIFYISSMRKSSEELNCRQAISNISYLCGEELEEAPYWETINNYLKTFQPAELQKIIQELVRRLIRSRIFEDAKIRGKYWQVIVDGTQLESSRRKLDGKCLVRRHSGKDGKEGKEGWTEYYYYVLEAKLVLHENIIVSIATEFVGEEGGIEKEKQDCELKACYRLMEKMKKAFPKLLVCLCGDSLYAGDPMFTACRNAGWHYLMRFKAGKIPYLDEEYEKLFGREPHERTWKDKDKKYWYGYVREIEYGKEHKINVIKYSEEKNGKEKRFCYITDLPVTDRNCKKTIEAGRRRWKIENEGFNTQKNGGYYLEHMFSRNYQAEKNHYYLIQIGHMIAQIMEMYEKIWKKIKQSREQKHRRILESWKTEDVSIRDEEIRRKCQIRLG